MSIQVFNLLNEYEIVVNNNKIYWTGADEWSPYEAGFVEDTDPDDIFTDYVGGEAEVIDDILVLNRPNKMTGKDVDASHFYEELEASPGWTATACFVTSLNERFPEIRYCQSGENVSFREAIYVMLKLGFSWDPDSDRFVRADIEEEKAQRASRVKAFLNSANSGISSTEDELIQ